MTKIWAIIRGLVALLVAGAATYILGSIINTQFVIGAHNIAVDFGDRINMTLFDISNMYLYLAIIMIAFIIGFSVAWVVKRFLPSLRAYAYPIAGGAALGLALGLMYIQFQTIPISGARSLAGYFSQVLAGCFGGWIFAAIAMRKHNMPKTKSL